MHNSHVLCGMEGSTGGGGQKSNVHHTVVANVALWKTMVFSECELFCLMYLHSTQLQILATDTIMTQNKTFINKYYLKIEFHISTFYILQLLAKTIH
jgi:hypothetical protein